MLLFKQLVLVLPLQLFLLLLSLLSLAAIDHFVAVSKHPKNVVVIVVDVEVGCHRFVTLRRIN